MIESTVPDYGPQLSRDDRIQAARLNLVVESLTATIIFNPVGVLIVCAALTAGEAVFGRISYSNMALAFALQCSGALAAWIVQRLHADQTPQDLKHSQMVLVALQAVLSVLWGLTAWLLWQDGNAANNFFIDTILLCVAWTAAFTRAVCRPVFLTGTLVLMGLFTLRFATGSGAAAHILFAITPILAFFLILIGAAGKRRVDEALQARFDNEDLSKALGKAMEVALEKRGEAEAANAAKTTFLANMSHELRTPLNAILGFSDIISHQYLGPEPERYADYAQDIHTSGSHLLCIINDLLDVAKIESGKMEIDPQALDPSQVLASVERMMAPRARAKSQRLTMAIEEGSPWLVADERAFTQIVLNLVSNAVKFTPERGHIAVTCRRGEDGGFLLIVEDDGVGIEAGKLDKVFQPFAQVDNSYARNAGGTGLGLALVQGLARLHGGRAWIESVIGRGTKVFVYFPLGIDPSLHAIQAFG